MQILDFNGIAIAAVFSQERPEEIREPLIRHMILNTIRRYNVKFRDEYGSVVIACDSYSWRKQFFEYYKANRKTSRDKSELDWTELFRLINIIKDELQEHFPYAVVKLKGAEADDIIGALVHQTQEFGHSEPVIIVSSDKDFYQLHQFSNVKQFSPARNSFVTCDDPVAYLFEHICKGDAGDGIPNIKSEDSRLVDGPRQSSIYTKKIAEWRKNQDNLQSVLGDELYRNFQRNEKLIDLSKIPTELYNDIIEEYKNECSRRNNGSSVFEYLVEKRCALLIECAAEFN
jgi:hypothetical protein